MSVLRFAALSLLALVPSVHAAPEPRVETLAQVIKRVDGAVVIVRTNERMVRPESGTRLVSSAGLGSGVLIDVDGKVLTAAHVAQAADRIVVEFVDGTQVGAQVVGSDPAADLALLQLERVPSGMQPATLGNSDGVDVGDEVFVIGAPLGMGHTMTVGHVSARRRPNTTYGGMLPAELFQTDASINQGNSGGPLFDRRGAVIGVVSHIMSTTGGSDGLGFVVTMNTVRRLLLDAPTVWTGLDGYLLQGPLASAFNVPHTGLLVQRIAKHSPAEQLGLRGGRLPVRIGDEPVVLGGDVILSVDGISLAAEHAYEQIRQRLVAARAARSPVRVTVLREGQQVELTSRFLD